MEITSFDAHRIRQAKAAFTTRRVPPEHMATLVSGQLSPQVGDLVLARVTQLGQHKKIQLISGRRSQLYPGDEIILAFGNRYAPDQFEGVVPERLGPCHMIAGGGIAAHCLCKSQQVKQATAIEALGLIGDAHGAPLRLNQYRLPQAVPRAGSPPILAVVGTAMNAGKTETVTQVVRGLTQASLRVGVAKITGTGAGGDFWSVSDAGANPVVDFTDAGLPSTYRMPIDQIEEAATSLIHHLSQQRVDLICLELGDGLYQAETAQLLRQPRFAGLVDGVLFAAGDAMGAASGVKWLREHDLPLLGVTGCLTASPLAIREAQEITGLPIHPTMELGQPEVIYPLVAPFMTYSAVQEAT